MSSTLKVWKILTDPTRLRILRLMEKEALTVSELQEILGMKQARISAHLACLREAGWVAVRREGRRAYYSADLPGAPARLIEAALEAARSLPERDRDAAGLRVALQKRKDEARVFFNQVAGRFGRNYGPGRSWQALARMLLRLVGPVVVADLGSGEGLVSQLLARRARRVIAIDNSEKMVAFGRRQARKNHLRNLEFRLGDLENPPLELGSVDVALLSQALHHAANPPRAVQSAHRILRKGGQILILDLERHHFDAARKLYGDHWLGFSQTDLHGWLAQAGFKDISIEVVSREEAPPHFQTLLAAAVK